MRLVSCLSTFKSYSQIITLMLHLGLGSFTKQASPGYLLEHLP